MKVLESPVKLWPGTITLPDFLTLPQAIEWEDALNDAEDLIPEIDFEKDENGKLITKNMSKKDLRVLTMRNKSKYANALIPGIKACVIEWNLQGFDPNNWPATPRQSRIDLVNWIVSNIAELYKEASEIPNA